MSQVLKHINNKNTLYGLYGTVVEILSLINVLGLSLDLSRSRDVIGHMRFTIRVMAERWLSQSINQSMGNCIAPPTNSGRRHLTI